jgi:hypothetical protein
LKEGVLDKENGVAYGSFMDNIESTGWSNLDIRSGYGSNSVDDVTIMYAAGYLEGALTAKRLYQHQQNILDYVGLNTTNSTSFLKLLTFINQQFAWTKKMIAENPNDPFWKHIDLVHSQFNGMMI